MENRHILQTSLGITLEFFIHLETLEMRVVWSPAKPDSRKKLKKVMREYLPWRDQIVQQAALKAGKRILIFTPENGQMNPKVFGPPAEKEQFV